MLDMMADTMHWVCALESFKIAFVDTAIGGKCCRVYSNHFSCDMVSTQIAAVSTILWQNGYKHSIAILDWLPSGWYTHEHLIKIPSHFHTGNIRYNSNVMSLANSVISYTRYQRMC